MRRYETDYAGLWRGHCKSRESAVIAATRHIMNDGYKVATITDKHRGEVVATVTLNADRTSVHIRTTTQIRRIGL